MTARDVFDLFMNAPFIHSVVKKVWHPFTALVPPPTTDVFENAWLLINVDIASEDRYVASVFLMLELR